MVYNHLVFTGCKHDCFRPFRFRLYTGSRFDFRSHLLCTGRTYGRYIVIFDSLANPYPPHYFCGTLRNGSFSLRSCSPDNDKKRSGRPLCPRRIFRCQYRRRHCHHLGLVFFHGRLQYFFRCFYRRCRFYSDSDCLCRKKLKPCTADSCRDGCFRFIFFPHNDDYLRSKA